MTFNIHGGQHGGVVNNIAGNQTNIGGQQGFHVADREALTAVASLRQQVDQLGLPPAVATTAQAELAAVEAELHGGRPDRRTVADRVTRLTQLLGSAGALASAGTALLGPLGTLASWLGAVGEPITRMLAR